MGYLFFVDELSWRVYTIGFSHVSMLYADKITKTCLDDCYLLTLRSVVLSGAKNLYDYLRDPSLSLRVTRLKYIR